MKTFSQFTNPVLEDIRLDLPKVSLTEGGMSKGDLFKRKNKVGFIEKGDNEELLDVDGNKLTIKDKSLWGEVVAKLEVAMSDTDLDREWASNVKKSLGVALGKVDKIANGFSTMTGKDPSGEDWEAGIAVGLMKLSGKNFLDTPEWERFGKYWGDWEDQAMKTAQDFITKLKISELSQTGAAKDAKLTKEWKGTNTTPKTDLMDKSGKKRVSLKKDGGSQLMSGKKDEAISTVEAAMRNYSASKTGQKRINDVLKTLEEKMITLSHKGSVGELEDMKGKKNLSPDFKKKIEELDLGHAYAKEINKKIEDLFKNEKDMKSLFCWEAATGHGKFGQDTWPTANVIVTFLEGGGISNILNLKDPVKDGSKLAAGNDFYVSFKSSGKSSPYLAFRSKKTKMQLNNSFEHSTLAEIIVEETMREPLLLNEDLEQLDEFQILNKVWQKTKEFAKSVVDKAKKIINAIIERIKGAFNWIKKQGSKIMNAMLYFFGIRIDKVNLKSGGGYPLDIGLKDSSFRAT